jgi:hypothetical protein
VEGAVEVGESWYGVTAPLAGAPPTSVIWNLDGLSARELTGIPRAVTERHVPLLLASRSDGRAVGLAAEGQPDIDGPTALWLIALDPATGAMSDPMALTELESLDPTAPVCTGDELGWRLDLPYAGEVRVAVGDWQSTLLNPTARVILSAGRGRACIEGFAGGTGTDTSSALRALRLASPLGIVAKGPHQTVTGSVFCGRTQFAVRCSPLPAANGSAP